MRLYAVRTGIVKTGENIVEVILESLKRQNCNWKTVICWLTLEIRGSEREIVGSKEYLENLIEKTPKALHASITFQTINESITLALTTRADHNPSV